MAPPPVTPTPRKFLAPSSKRSSSASRQQQQRQDETSTRTGSGSGTGTPGPPTLAPSVLSSQFQATPRFSLRSTPRASGLSSYAATSSQQQQHAPSTPVAAAAVTAAATSTPGTLLLHQQKQRQQQSVHTARFREDLIVDSSPPPPLPSPDVGDSDSVEEEEEVVASSSALRNYAVVDDDDDDGDDEDAGHALSHRIEEDVDLIRDSSPPAPPPPLVPTLPRGKREGAGGEAEVQGSQSQSDDGELRSPSPKRRRRASSIVVSSSSEAGDLESSPRRGQQQQQQQREVKLEDSDFDATDDFAGTPTRGENTVAEEEEEEGQGEDDMDIDREEEEEEEEDTDDSAFSSSSSLPSYRHHHHRQGTPTGGQQQPQPKFHRAPRFKPPELSTAAARRDPLPDAFSPQRRRRGGQRYVPGGLAAEVRDWLVAVEAGKAIGSGSSGGNAETGTGAEPKKGGGEEEEEDRRGDWAAKLAVNEVRAAPGMVLIAGQRWQQEETVGGTTGAAATGATIQVVLAGSGRLVGLAGRNEVVAGAVVGIARPTWDIAIQELGNWTVACDWMVLH